MWRAPICCLAFIIFVGCQKESPTPTIYTRLDLYESVAARPLIEQVCQDCNLLLKPQLEIRLFPSWKPLTDSDLHPTPTPTPKPLEIESKLNFGGVEIKGKTVVKQSYNPALVDFLKPKLPIPKRRFAVYLVRGGRLSAQDIAFRSPEDEAILINADGFAGLLTLLHILGKTEDDSLRWALDLVVLHEIGHIVHGDVGPVTTMAEITADDFKKQSDKIKNRELAADRFAIEQITAAQNSFYVERMGLGLGISTFLASRSFDIGMSRLLDKDHKPIKQTSQMFSDIGYTHPNTELRLIFMSGLAFPSPENEALLKSFLERRRSAVRPPVAGQ